MKESISCSTPYMLCMLVYIKSNGIFIRNNEVYEREREIGSIVCTTRTVGMFPFSLLEKCTFAYLFFWREREIQKYRVSLLLYIDVCIKNYICKYSFEQDVFVKHNAPDNGQFQRRPRSQGQVERSCHKK